MSIVWKWKWACRPYICTNSRLRYWLRLHDKEYPLVVKWGRERATADSSFSTEISIVRSESTHTGSELPAGSEHMHGERGQISILVMITMEQNSEADIRFSCFVDIHAQACKKQPCCRAALTSQLLLFTKNTVLYLHPNLWTWTLHEYVHVLSLHTSTTFQSEMLYFLLH